MTAEFIKNFYVAFISLLTAALIVLLGNAPGYSLLFTQPLIFCFFYLFVFSRALNGKGLRPFLLVYTVIAALRFVLLPLLIVLSGYYSGRSHVEPLNDSYSTAIMIMNWELVVCGSLIAFLETRQKKRLRQSFQERLPDNQQAVNKFDAGYLVFGIFAFFLALAFPKGIAAINFIFPNEVALDFIEVGTFDNFVSYAFLLAKSLTFLVVTKKMGRLYSRRPSSIYLYIALFFAFINIFTYWGTNRSDIIISSFATYLVLLHVFGKIINRYATVGFFLLIVIIGSVSQHRENVSITGGSNTLVDVTDLFQVYTGGPYNVAISIETKDYYPEASHLSVLLFDVFRPMIGVNILLKDMPQVYSNIYFNMRMWTHVDRRSQILPMIGQGNLYFGFLFSPIFSILFVLLAYFLERIYQSTIPLELYYFIGLALIRLGFMMGQNTMNMINDISMNLFLFLLVYFFNKKTKQIF